MGIKTKVFLVRHGETEWNLSGRWQGHLDAPLTERGEDQARCLGERLQKETFDACFVSDLGRAVKTSEIAGAPSALVFERDERIRERDLGVIQGMTTAEMLDSCPDVYHSFRNDGPDYVLPEGESFRQFQQRCIDALEDFASRHPGGRLLVISHGGVLGAIFRHVTGIPLGAPRRFLLMNCSVNIVEKDEKDWTLRSWGDVSHLKDLESLDDS